MQSVGSTGPSLPAFCYYFNDTSVSLHHFPLPRLSELTTKDLENPFSASNLSNLTHGSCPLPISSLSASHGLAFSSILLVGLLAEGSLPQTCSLSPIDGALCLPFLSSNCVTHCSDPIDGKPVYQTIGFCHQFARGDSFLHFAYLRLKNGSLIAPFSTSNCDILCQDSTEASPAM